MSDATHISLEITSRLCQLTQSTYTRESAVDIIFALSPNYSAWWRAIIIIWSISSDFGRVKGVATSLMSVSREIIPRVVSLPNPARGRRDLASTSKNCIGIRENKTVKATRLPVHRRTIEGQKGRKNIPGRRVSRLLLSHGRPFDKSLSLWRRLAAKPITGACERSLAAQFCRSLGQA